MVQAAQKSTKITTKPLKPVADRPMRRFWLAISCITALIIWYCPWVLLFQVQSALLNYVIEIRPVMYLYDVVFILSDPLILLLPAGLSVPFAWALFRRQQVKAPLFDAVGLLGSVVFGYSLFILLLLKFPTLYDLPGFGLLAAFAGAMTLSIVLYGLLVRAAGHKLSKGWLYTIMIGLPLLTMVISAVSQLSLLPIF